MLPVRPLVELLEHTARPMLRLETVGPGSWGWHGAGEDMLPGGSRRWTGEVHFTAGKDGLGEGGGDSSPRKTNELMPTPPETLGGEAHAWLPRQGLGAWGGPQRGGGERPSRTRPATTSERMQGAQSPGDPPNHWLEGEAQSQLVLFTLT